MNLTRELNEFITALYGKEPTMKNKTWQQLYPDEFAHIAKDLFRFQVASARAGVPCDQTHIMTFLVYEERTRINNAKFIAGQSPSASMKMLQLSAQIKTKLQAEYNERLAARKAVNQ